MDKKEALQFLFNEAELEEQKLAAREKEIIEISRRLEQEDCRIATRRGEIAHFKGMLDKEFDKIREEEKK